ncbi:MAG: S41 family peptidase [Deltaproteobacteria bacterium]|nr:S41 family peptidase [Deltaproteobacteria bacterium]
MKKRIKFSSVVFIGFCLAISIFVISQMTEQVRASEKEQKDEYGELKIFTDVIALVRKNYYEEVEFKKLVNGAIKGMMLTLDPHSSYLDPETYKDLKVETKGEFGGLGIEITLKEGLLTVVTPIEDSPAARIGIKAGDQIIKIGEEYTKDISLNDAVKKMRGPKGTPVSISIHREGRKSLIPFTIIRDVIKVKSVRSRQLDNGYGYIRLAQFQEDSIAEFNKALKKIAADSLNGEIKGLIVDLRNNPGGLLTQAIRIADAFLEEGVIVYTDGRLESQKQKYYAYRDGNEPRFPMVALVNEGSASASEIVAGALQDAARAIIVGKQTFGKGSVQTIIPMDNNDALRLTTALYFTRSGRSIQAQGITPDIAIESKKLPEDKEELPKEELSFPKEKDLPGAIKNPKNNKSEEEAPAEIKPDAENGAKAPKILLIGSQAAMEADLKILLEEDPQLNKALEILKNWKDYEGKYPQPSSSSSSVSSMS